MTTDKHQKRKIRGLAERMGTTYSTARQTFLGADRPLSTFQSSATEPSAPALHSPGHRLLCAPLPADQRPTEDHRVLEVSLLWGDTLIDVRCFAPRVPVRIGPAEPAEIRVYDDAIPATFDLLTEDSVAIPPGATLALSRDGEPLERSNTPCVLGLDDRALLSLATTHLILRWVRPSTRLADRPFDALDLYFTRALSMTFLIHLFLLVGFWISPITEEGLTESLFRSPSPLVKVRLTKPPPPLHSHTALTTRPAPSTHSPPRPASVSRPHAQPGGRSQVLRAGLLDGVNMSALLSGPDRVSAALGVLTKGPRIGDLGGIGGFGSRGTGPGPGGGPLDIGGGIGGPGIGRGPAGALSFGGGHKTTAIVDRQPSHVEGGALSKEVIASIVHKHENEIRYCYESALSGHPELAGKVSVAFTISGTGEVSDANVGESSLGNAAVESCIATKVRRWRFPEPRGGGQVFVTYPWIFKPAGD